MSTAALFADDVFVPVGDTRTIPLGDIVPWAIFGILLAMICLYFVSTEQGAFALFRGMYIHEFVHDGRHLLGFPCH